MNNKIFRLFLLLFFSSSVYGNTIISYKVRIIHPVLTLPAEPLIIKEIIKWHYGEVDSSICKYYPMMFVCKEFYNGKEDISGKGRWTLYYDAFITPDSNSYILVKVKTGYESLEIFSIELKEKGSIKWKIQNPGCNEIFWSKDNKYFVTGATAWIEHPKLTFYDKSTGKKVRDMEFPFWDEYQKYFGKNLILLKSW